MDDCSKKMTIDASITDSSFERNFRCESTLRYYHNTSQSWWRPRRHRYPSPGKENKGDANKRSKMGRHPHLGKLAGAIRPLYHP